ncbi:DUF2975 domain-containing protein [Arthrobacter sp. GMC3]|uniref:DUF2975 domain-containing protein n=1 Tax=Arthrobacter sp. GMC3 TaxID=2058894 RepID=UPI000CE3AD9A|nr:DUF2975 domain-containing protein [Arthrobacter sp. GMC3]
MNESVIGLLRAFLVALFLGTLLGQIVIVPNYASESAAQFPEVAFLTVPYTLVVIVAIACLQLVLLAIWVLLDRVQSGAIFTSEAYRWVNVIIVAAASATALVLLLGSHLLGVMHVGGPGVLVAVVGASVCGTTFVLLMLVMRGLLHSATAMGRELALPVLARS